MTSSDSSLDPPAAAAIPATASRGFVDWLTSQNVALAFTTYQTGKLFLIGHNEHGRLSVYERNFERAMGLCGNDQTLYMASLYQLWRIENALQPGETVEGYDRYYVPQVGHTTGDLNIHDIALAPAPGSAPGSASAAGNSGTPGSSDASGGGKVHFISARFSCLATLSERYHFNPVWMPKFITKLAGEDRCHLNGLAMVDGKPRYTTACAQTDVVDGWREHRREGGVVIDIESDEVIATDLSMPHSPRWYRDKLWLLDSGNGQFGYLDPATGRFERVTFCPGFARGLSFVGDYAVVGLSLSRHDPTFQGLALEDELKAASVSPRCGLLIIDLNSGDVVEWLRLDEPVRELYDVLALPSVKRPRLVGFKTDEIRTRVWADPAGLARIAGKTPSTA